MFRIFPIDYFFLSFSLFNCMRIYIFITNINCYTKSCTTCCKHLNFSRPSLCVILHFILRLFCADINADKNKCISTGQFLCYFCKSGLFASFNWKFSILVIATKPLSLPLL